MKINPILFKSFRVPFVIPFLLIFGFFLFNFYGCEIGIKERLYFKNENVEIIHEKTLWDWMQLLIVPVILFGGGIYLNKREKSKEKIEREKRDEEDKELLKIQYEESKLIEYMDAIQSLIQDKDLQKEPMDSLVITVTRIRTIAILKLISGKRVSDLFDFLKATKILYRVKGKNKHKFVFHFLMTNLSNLDFSESIAIEATFHHISFTNCNFQNANLNYSDFVECRINFAKMEKAKFNYSKFPFSEFLDTDFEESDFSNAEFSRSIFIRANFTKARFIGASGEGAEFGGVNFEGADLTKAIFWWCSFCHANFLNAKIVKVKLLKCNLERAIFDYAQLDETDFRDVEGLKPDQLEKAYYIENPPILPDGIKPPLQYEEWEKKFG